MSYRAISVALCVVLVVIMVVGVLVVTGYRYGPIMLGQEAGSAVVEEALKNIERTTEEVMERIMAESVAEGATKDAMESVAAQATKDAARAAIEGQLQANLADEAFRALSGEEQKAVIQQQIDNNMRKTMEESLFPSDPEKYVSSTPYSGDPPAQGDIYSPGNTKGNYFETKDGWQKVNRWNDSGVIPNTYPEGEGQLREMLQNDPGANFELEDSVRGQDPETGKYDNTCDATCMNNKLDQLLAEDSKLLAKNGGRFFQDAGGEWKEIKIDGRNPITGEGIGGMPVPKVTPNILPRITPDIGNKLEGETAEGATNQKEAAEKRKCGKDECWKMKAFGHFMMYASMGFMLYKSIFAKPPSSSPEDPAKIWDHSPVPDVDLCYPNTAVFQDPHQQPTQQPYSKDVSSNECVQSCFSPSSDCKSITYYQKDTKQKLPSQCFHFPHFDPNALGTQPPYDQNAILTTYDCTDFPPVSRNILLNDTGCFDYAGNQIVEKNCNDCPGMGGPGKMCWDPLHNKDVPCSDSSPEKQCHDLNNCTYLSKTCPENCTSSGSPDTPNHWVDRIAAVRNLAYVGCYKQGEYPPDHDCINGKCTDSKYPDKKSCEAAKKTWCSACPNQQICGECPGQEKGKECGDGEYSRFQECYNLMCTCPADDIISGKCGAIVDSSMCDNTTMKQGVVWRGAQDLGTLCMPPNCWVDGVPDDQYTDPVSCTQQPFSEWVVNTGTKDISGSPCAAPSPATSPPAPPPPSDPGKVAGLTKTQWIYVGVTIGVIILVMVLAAVLTHKSKSSSSASSAAPLSNSNAVYGAPPASVPPQLIPAANNIGIPTAQ